MQAVIFIGLPASGKSSFYKSRFFATHVHISLDLLKTRHRERLFLETCLETDQRFVIDNTNPAASDRARYIEPARNAGYAVVGFYFASKVEDCLRRNAERTGRERVPDVAILSAAQRLERPSPAEGFAALYHVSMQDGQFLVGEWEDEV